LRTELNQMKGDEIKKEDKKVGRSEGEMDTG
jgi:hypothetical protein